MERFTRTFRFEAEILTHYFQLDSDIEKRFGGFTGEFIITGENAEIIYHQKPVSESKNSSNLLKI